MANEAGRPSIRGGWLGTRCSRSSLGVPVRFEATFTGGAGEASPGAFGGTVLDDTPAAAAAAGRISHGLQTGRHVRFRQTDGGDAPAASPPLHYQGTLSEDGQALSGTWERTTRHNGRLLRATGHWEARRLFWPDEAETGRL